MADTENSIAIDSLPDGWADRFWAKVRQSDGCWEWAAKSKAGNGYGVHCTKAIPLLGAQDYAHRIAYFLSRGEWPGPLFVLHRCDNPGCVRPDHLFLGSPADNMADMVAKGRDRQPTKVSNEHVQEMRRAYAVGGVTFFDLAERFDISFQHAHAIVRGKTRRSVPNV